MTTDKVIIKLLQNPGNAKLKMKYPGSITYATPKTGRDGKVVTGFDEESYEMLSIDDDAARKKAQTALIKERKEIEKVLKVDLSPSSDFWHNFYIPLTDEEIVLDAGNANDRIKEKFLVANRYVAPSEDAINDDEDFMRCVYYLHREKEETAKKASKQQQKDKAKAKLYNLLESNPNKLKTIGSYIFGFGTDDLTADAVYMRLSEFLETTDVVDAKKNIDQFLAALELSVDQLQVKIIFDKAVKKRSILLKGGIYRRGDRAIGNSYEDALENLGSPEFNSELASLIKEVGV